MTPDEIQTLVQNIVTEAGGAADLVGVLDPELIPFIAIGRAVASQVPGLAGSVARWVSGNEPTDAEKADLLAKLSVLSDPNAP